MARKYLTPIDLNQNELQNAKAQSLASDPGSPQDGQFWYNTTATEWRARINAVVRAFTWVTGTTPTAEAVASSASVGTAVDAARADHRHAMPGNATSGVDGFMPGTDKTKIDAATAAATASTLVFRDSNSRFQAADPSAAQDVATKTYVDSSSSGLDVKSSVRVATAGVALSTIGTTPTYTATGGTSARGQITWATGPTAMDGVTLANTDRMLVKDEGGGSHASNGIWVRTSANTWDRATDFDSDAEATAGSFAFVEEGTVNGDTGWVMSTNNPITLGGASGTALSFTQFSSSAAISAGAGLLKTGNTIDIQSTGGGITVNADDIAITTNGISNAMLRQSAALTVVANATNATANVADLAAASDHQVLRRNGTALAFGAVNLAQAAAITGTLPDDNGGTGQSTYAAGDLLYASAADTLSKRAIGSTSDILTVVAGVPAWSSAATLTLTKKYATDVGDGAATSYVITHNLNSRDVQVGVYQATSTYDEVECDVQHTGLNTVTLLFAVAPTNNQYRVVCIG